MFYNDMALEMFSSMEDVNRIVASISFMVWLMSLAGILTPFLSKLTSGKKIRITTVFSFIYLTLVYGILWTCSKPWENLFLLGILSLAWLILSMIYFVFMLRKKHLKQDATSAVKYDSEQDMTEKEGEADIPLDSQDPLDDQIVQMVREYAQAVREKCLTEKPMEKGPQLKMTGYSLDDQIIRINALLKKLKEQGKTSFVERIERIYLPELNEMLSYYVQEKEQKTKRSKEVVRQIKEVIGAFEHMLQDSLDSSYDEDTLEIVAKIDALKTKIRMDHPDRDFSGKKKK